MAKQDYYSTLGVGRNASDQEIRSAYRKLAMKYHPDRNQEQGAEQKFKEVKQAYEVLSDEGKRAAYDQVGHDTFTAGGSGGPGPAGAGGFGGFGGFGGGAQGFESAFEDIFGDFFGGGGARRGQRGTGQSQGQEIRQAVELSLEEAAFGTEKNVRVTSMQSCEVCSGSGATPGSSKTTCGTCGGSGVVQMQQGFFAVQQTCPHCRGAGEQISDPCRTCGGSGRTRDTRTLSVRIPAGVDEGQIIRLSGEGEAGEHGGPPGDLFIHVRVAEHPIFKRQGRHLYIKVPVLFTTAALGGQVEVPTLGSPKSLKIPAGTQSGEQFRLRGQGLTNLNGDLGDLLCTVHIETPVNLTAEQKGLLSQLESSITGRQSHHSPRTDNWVDSIRDFFSKL